MKKAINDATLKQAGTMYQYMIALKDCFELNDGETLQIEINGDVSIMNDTGGIFQKEVKHHFSDQSLSNRDIDFWKTLANWYTDYDRVKDFSQYILSTTAKILDDSPFYNWNSIDKYEKLKRLKDIGEVSKEREGTFRCQYNRIFSTCYDEHRILAILDKFVIEDEKTSIAGISKEFSKYIRSIPEENRDGYIGALLGRILNKVKKPPHKWEITKTEFDEFCQVEAVAYVKKNCAPLPTVFAKEVVSDEKVVELQQKKFIESIREIKYNTMISRAILDYWKTDMTVIEYFKKNSMYLESLEEYYEDLQDKMFYEKSKSEINAEHVDENEKIKISKTLYNDVMGWDAIDFGWIIHNQGFFQRGIIHSIVDETEFRWKVGEEKNEYK